MKLTPLLFILFIVISISGCGKKDSLKGFDKAALFAMPTRQEIEAVGEMWSKRDLAPTEVKIEQTHSISSRLSLHIISFNLAGIEEYAGVLVPLSADSLPVVFYVGGFPQPGQPSVNSVHIQLSPQQADSLPFIYVVPALRGQYVSVKVNDTEYSSPLSQGFRFDAFDGATDDVIAGLNAIGTLFPNADTSTAMIRGGSRGGTVALLAAERDQRFKRVAAIAVNVDFVNQTASHQNDPIYKSQFLNKLIEGTATIAETRQAMIAASPLYFCRYLPKTQLHCAAEDQITPVVQGRMLLDTMKSHGLNDQVQLFIYPNRNHDNIANDNIEMERRINEFFGELW